MGGNKFSLFIESFATKVTSAAIEILSSEVLLDEVECIVLEGKINISSTSGENVAICAFNKFVLKNPSTDLALKICGAISFGRDSL